MQIGGDRKGGGQGQGGSEVLGLKLFQTWRLPRRTFSDGAGDETNRGRYKYRCATIYRNRNRIGAATGMARVVIPTAKTRYRQQHRYRYRNCEDKNRNKNRYGNRYGRRFRYKMKEKKTQAKAKKKKNKKQRNKNKSMVKSLDIMSPKYLG